MKKHTFTLATCLLAAHISAAVMAEESNPLDSAVPAVQAAAGVQAVSQADVDEHNNLSDASTKDITPKTLNDFFDEFAERQGINYGESRDGRTFFTGRASVIMADTDQAFGRALNLAFDEAMLNLQAEFVRENFGRQSETIHQKFYQDDSTNAREFEKLPPESKVSQILSKVANLAGAKLDSALNEMGVTGLEGLTEERKKVLLGESIVQEISVNAFGNMQGLVPVQTSITKGSGNSYQIGVIAVMSDKTRQIATDMRQKRASLVTGKGRALQDVLPESNEGFIAEHGIRLIYNEQGAPVIISYGQWSYQPENDDYINNRKRESAEEQAIARADAAVSAFINRAIEFKRSSQSAAEVERSITESVTGNDVSTSEKTAKEIIDITNRDVTARSDMNLRGLRTLKRWSAKDANGVEYVGAVRVYSHANVENSARMVEPVKTSTTQAKPASVRSGQNVSTKSRIINDMDDF